MRIEGTESLQICLEEIDIREGDFEDTGEKLLGQFPCLCCLGWSHGATVGGSFLSQPTSSTSVNTISSSLKINPDS